MAAPSNIRINPFIGDGGTTNYVNFIEKHIVPAVSPFVIRLNGNILFLYLINDLTEHF